MDLVYYKDEEWSFEEMRARHLGLLGKGFGDVAPIELGKTPMKGQCH